MTPKWLQLVESVSQNPDIARHALTVAFLVGGCRNSLEQNQVTVEEAKLELTQLLNSLVDDAPRGKMVRLTRCANIRQPVVTLIDAHYGMAAENGIYSAEQKRRTLIADSEFIPAAESSAVIDLTNKLFLEIGEPICAAQFSFRRGRYTSFNERELGFIRDAALS